MTAPEAVDAATFADPEAFRRDVVAHGRPVILRGLCAAWPAAQAARASDAALVQLLRDHATPRRAQAFVGAPAIAGRYFYGDRVDQFNFDRAELNLAELLDKCLTSAGDPQQPTYYMGSLPVEAFLHGFEQDNGVHGLPATARPRIWIGNASHVACHYDAFENLACVVAGQRRFTLYPPQAIPDMYVGPIDQTMAGQPVSLAAGDPEHPERYPRFAQAQALRMEAVLEPGDALFIPKLWWHQVEAMAPFNVMINYWWDAFATGPDAPMLAMLLSMITLAERPEHDRAAFRAFFDHFVFRQNGHPLTHLPEDQRGVLRDLGAGGYGQIRAMIMQALRRGG